MKLMIITITTAALFAGAVHAQTTEGGSQPPNSEKSQMTKPSTTGAAATTYAVGSAGTEFQWCQRRKGPDHHAEIR